MRLGREPREWFATKLSGVGKRAEQTRITRKLTLLTSGLSAIRMMVNMIVAQDHCVMSERKYLAI